MVVAGAVSTACGECVRVDAPLVLLLFAGVDALVLLTEECAVLLVPIQAPLPPLAFKFVQLKIITGELSCKSGNDEENVELPAIDLVNLAVHVVTAPTAAAPLDLCVLCVVVALVAAVAAAAVVLPNVSIDLRVLKRRIAA